MTKGISSALLVLGLFAVLSTPSALFAQEDFNATTGGGSIVPQCTGEILYEGTNERECTFCDFMQLIRNILNFIIFFSVITAGALFAYVGWLYVIGGGEPGKRAAAKKIFQNIIIGLVILLGAYTIVDTIMKTLVNNGNFTVESWSTLCPNR